jgi:hypothetical protein
MSKYYAQEVWNEVCSILKTNKYLMPKTKFIHLGDMAPDICAPLCTSRPVIMSAWHTHARTHTRARAHTHTHTHTHTHRAWWLKKNISSPLNSKLGYRNNSTHSTVKGFNLTLPGFHRKHRSVNILHGKDTEPIV